MPDLHHHPPIQPGTRLATKIILFVFLSTFVSALVVSWISIQSTHAYLSRVIDRHYPVAIAHAGTHLSTWLVAAEDELAGLARAPALISASKAGNRSKRLHQRLESALRDSPHFAGLAVVGKDGAVGSQAGVAPDAGPTVERALGPKANLIGVLPASKVAGFLEDGRPEPLANVVLVDGAGEVLVGSDPAQPVDRIPLADLIRDGGPHTLDYANANGLHVIGTAFPLGFRDWHVALEMPFDVAFAPVASVVTRILVIDLCIILIFSGLAYRITLAVVKPIDVLSEAARRVAQGNFNPEIAETDTDDEIGLLTGAFSDMMKKLRGYQSEIEATNRDLQERNAELQAAKETFEQLSITDGLTKLHNHRFFQDHMTREIKRVQRSKEPLSMLLLDIDDFKRLNDRAGHAAGDELLRGIARIMGEIVRESDLLARYGGEEFVVLMPNTDMLGAYQLAEKIRTAIAETSFILDDSLRPTRITVSIGVARYEGNRKTFFQWADRALYRAKARGKNCVVMDDDDSVV